jgi:hypothetical protein
MNLYVSSTLLHIPYIQSKRTRSKAIMAKDNCITWKLMSQVENCLREAGGTIFGGKPRDSHIHNVNAGKFYDKISEMDHDEFMSNRQKYSDPEFLPEFIGRLHLPSDIDAFMKTSQIDDFKKLIEKNMLRFKEKSTANASIYFEELEPSTRLKHTKFEVCFAMNPIMRYKFEKVYDDYKIKVDVIHADDVTGIEPPFGKLDMECNGILVTSENEYKLCKNLAQDYPQPGQKLKKLNSVLDDILEKKTTLVSDRAPIFRIQDMVKRGWRVKGKELEVFIEKEEVDVCMLCQGDFKNSKIRSKFMCCNNRMHPNCAKEMIEKSQWTGSCPMCRKELNISAEDIRLTEV